MSFTDLLTSDLLLLVTPVPTTNHVITTQSHVHTVGRERYLETWPGGEKGKGGGRRRASRLASRSSKAGERGEREIPRLLIKWRILVGTICRPC